MKNLFIVICLLCSLSLFGQSDSKSYKHEIKVNVFNAVLGNPELTYEYLINRNSGLGLYGNVNLDNNKIYPYNYMAGIYYRLYVGGRYASGFFIECGVSALNEEYEEYYFDPVTLTDKFITGNVAGAGPSIALGGKFPIHEKIVFEFFGGIGRNFSSNEHVSLVFPRVGVSLGARF